MSIMTVVHKIVERFQQDRRTMEELQSRVEYLEEKSTDVAHDLHVLERRRDTLYKLIRDMQGPTNV